MTRARMKAIQISNKSPHLVNLPEPKGDGVKVNIRVASICSSDLHLMNNGWAENRILGHEFAGFTEDGTAVAIEPIVACGSCDFCDDGYHNHCSEQAQLFGVGLDGGMAESIIVPANILVPIPSGLAIENASLIEPLAVALHGLNRANINSKDKILVIGAGAIGLMSVIALYARGFRCDLVARYDHQRNIAENYGTSKDISEGYSLVIDAVGNSDSVQQASQKLRPMGRILMLGSFWDGANLNLQFSAKELTIIGAATYRCGSSQRDFAEAASILANDASIARNMITHRFPLEGCDEAFNTATDRSQGAVKVVFDLPTR